MTTCPHCHQPIPDPPKPSNALLYILVADGVGIVSCGMLIIVCLTAISTIGSPAHIEFKNVGNSMTAS